MVFDIQRSSTHDGPGIRTTIFFKGCPLRCSWCQNPESIAPHRQLLVDANRCIGCEACRKRCDLITGSAKAETCRDCGDCAEACPSGARTMAGELRSVERLVEAVERDRAYYGGNGGVTFCGGEPLQQWGAVRELARMLRDRGLHVALDTCALASKPVLDEVPGCVDLIIADLKCVSPDRHRRWTGADNRSILEAIRCWNERVPNRLWISLPVIPEVHDEEEIEKEVSFLLSLAHLPTVRVVPFQRMGYSKYRQLGLEEPRIHGLAARGVETMNGALSVAGVRVLCEP
jgi:pyruvate formate lyase activating enzyme